MPAKTNLIAAKIAAIADDKINAISASRGQTRPARKIYDYPPAVRIWNRINKIPTILTAQTSVRA